MESELPEWDKVEEVLAPRIEQAREYTEMVTSRLNKQTDPTSDEDGDYDWQIAGPAYQRLPLSSFDRGQGGGRGRGMRNVAESDRESV